MASLLLFSRNSCSRAHTLRAYSRRRSHRSSGSTASDDTAAASFDPRRRRSPRRRHRPPRSPRTAGDAPGRGNVPAASCSTNASIGLGVARPAASASRARPCPAPTRASWSSATSCGCPPRRCSSDTASPTTPTRPPGRRAGARTRCVAPGSASPSRMGSASATAADCPSTVDRSWRATVRRTMYSTSGREPARGLANAVGAVLRDEVGGIQPLRHDHHDRLHRDTSPGTRTRARLRARRPRRSRTRGPRVARTGEQTEVRLPQRRAARGAPRSRCRPAPARSRPCIPRPRRPRRCARSRFARRRRLYSTSFFW